jgi:hypothetical protein
MLRSAVLLATVIAAITSACGPREEVSYDRPRASDLFSIALPDGAVAFPRVQIDYMPGDSDASGEWAGRRWRIIWSWWREALGASTTGLDRRGRPHPGIQVQRSNQDWFNGLPETCLVVSRMRCYRWREQLLMVSLTEIEPSDSLQAERLLASVRFDPRKHFVRPPLSR